MRRQQKKKNKKKTSALGGGMQQPLSDTKLNEHGTLFSPVPSPQKANERAREHNVSNGAQFPFIFIFISVSLAYLCIKRRAAYTCTHSLSHSVRVSLRSLSGDGAYLLSVFDCFWPKAESVRVRIFFISTCACI